LGSPTEESVKLREAVIRRIRDEKVLDEFFSVRRCHQQLIVQSEGLLRLLLSTNNLTEEDLEMIWQTID
jgi:hypothetical protein